MSQHPIGSERRASSRIHVRECRLAYAVDTLFVWRKPELSRPQVMLDISHGGVSMACADYVEPGTKLRLTMGFVGDTALYEARGRVCYCRKMPEAGLYRIGIVFTKKDDRLDRAIKYLVEKFV